MFRIVLCLPGQAQRQAVRRVCADYFAQNQEPFALTAADPGDLAALAGADMVFFSAVGPRPNGLDAARRLRAAGSRATLVFLASGPEYAAEAFGLWALQYLTPPVTAAQLRQTLEWAARELCSPALAVPAREGLRRVPYRDIEYVECTDHILHFHLADGELVRSSTLRISLGKALAPLLADRRFYQPHRSYVVNLDRARTLGDAELVMESGARIPVPRGRAAEAHAAYLAALGSVLPPAQEEP